MLLLWQCLPRIMTSCFPKHSIRSPRTSGIYTGPIRVCHKVRTVVCQWWLASCNQQLSMSQSTSRTGNSMNSLCLVSMLFPAYKIYAVCQKGISFENQEELSVLDSIYLSFSLAPPLSFKMTLKVEHAKTNNPPGTNTLTSCTSITYWFCKCPPP